MLLRKQAIIYCHIFPPHLINASTLPCETENTEIVNSLLFWATLGVRGVLDCMHMKPGPWRKKTSAADHWFWDEMLSMDIWLAAEGYSVAQIVMKRKLNLFVWETIVWSRL